MDSERFDIAKAIVLSGWALLVLICMSVIGVAMYSLAVHGSVDTALKDWAQMCFAYLFGALPMMVKDFINAPKGSGQ